MKKLTIIGGGSVRAPFFANSLAKRAKALHISTLCLYDTDPEKLRIIGSIAKHAAGKVAPDLNVVLETDITKAISGTDYFVTTIRVGGDHSSLRRRIPWRPWRTTAAGSRSWRRMPGSSTSPIPPASLPRPCVPWAMTM